ncbi:MAG: IS3 family transposase [Sterolibacteriaceae bacterium]|uniref:IS3 family transposase n=1 Tax=Candidatus Methylophosphatis roskildensis TaxID=2899263 RepID=A0A9D7E2X5_9PROT|nr:IS3 family transposase [Candidatus Methylophosphatis roskildensis]MBK7235734.1 IS3 family transposase [Sterolibacteriaceae bacterium]
MKYAGIDSHRDHFSIGSMCRLLEVSRSGLHDWRHRPVSQRSQDDARLAQELHARYLRHRGKYGRPRLTADLREAGFRVNHKCVHRLMRRGGLHARQPRRFERTTDSRHGFALAPNVLDQRFETSAPDRVWLADITYVATDEGWLYVAIVMDLFSRKFVGWAMSAHVDGALTLNALHLALGRRHPGQDLIHHSDRGSQYCTTDYRQRLAEAGITVSMSRRANCYDNVPMESANGTLKVERVYDEHYATRQQAIDDLTAYFGYYNTERRHSALGYLSPAEFERRWYAQQNRASPRDPSYPRRALCVRRKRRTRPPGDNSTPSDHGVHQTGTGSEGAIWSAWL